jgi:hypothetical protein
MVSYFYALLAFHSREASVTAFLPLRICCKQGRLQRAGVHPGRCTPARSERHSEVRSECDGVRRRRAYRPIETDWQVRLYEVSLEQAPVSMLDRKTFVNQGRKSHCRLVYDECRA